MQQKRIFSPNRFQVPAGANLFVTDVFSLDAYLPL